MVTVTLKAVSFGTELHVLQEGLRDVLPLEHCYLGGGSRWCCRQNW